MLIETKDKEDRSVPAANANKNYSLVRVIDFWDSQRCRSGLSFLCEKVKRKFFLRGEAFRL
jgi:hypothetical protein